MPKTYRHEAFIPLPPACVFAVLTDIAHWPDWDLDLVATRYDGETLRAGSRFSITPKGAGPVAMRVAALEAPTLFVDQASLPLASIHGVHRLLPTEGGTRLIHEVTTTGLLAFLWDRIVTRNIGAGLAVQAARLRDYAVGISSTSKSGPP